MDQFNILTPERISEIRKELEKEATESIKNIESNICIVYTKCSRWQGKVIKKSNMEEVLVLGGCSSWDPYGGDIYYIALNPEFKLEFILVNERLTEDVYFEDRLVDEDPENPWMFVNGEKNPKYEFWYDSVYYSGSENERITKMVRDYFEEHQTEYMFTPIFLPDCDYSISLPYETTIPSIYLSILEHQSKITRPEITIGFFDPYKYPNEYAETLGCFVTEGTVTYIKGNEFENIQEKLCNTNKPEKFYLLDEDKYNSIKEFCKYSCIMSNSECCKSCQIKNILQ